MSHQVIDHSKKLTIKISHLMKLISRLENKRILYATMGQKGGTMGQIDYELTIIYEDKNNDSES
jgi:hypothetical protein